MPSDRVDCPCCGYLTLTHRAGFEICPVCFWEDDGQDDVDAHIDRGGPNRGTLWEARTCFLKYRACERVACADVRPPRADEPPQRCWTLLHDEAVELVPGADVSPWNLLHDGIVVGLSRTADRVVVTLKCGYLRSRFPVPGSTFVIELLACTLLEYAPYDEAPIAALDAILAAQPDFATAELVEGDVIVFGGGGTLRLRYQSLALRFDSGASLALAALDACAIAYWREFEQRTKSR